MSESRTRKKAIWLGLESQDGPSGRENSSFELGILNAPNLRLVLAELKSHINHSVYCHCRNIVQENGQS